MRIEGRCGRTPLSLAHALEMSIKGIASCACPGLDPIAVSGKRRVGRLDDRVGR